MQKIFFKSLMVVGLAGSVASCNAPWLEGKAGEEYVYEEDVTLASYEDTYVEPIEPAPVFNETPTEAAKVYNKRVPPLNTVIVCRDKQCAPAELSMSKEYIFNSLAQLIDNNLDETALLCEANAQAHVCVNPYLTVPAKVGVTPAYVYFDGVKLVDGSSVKGKTALNLALAYNLSYNGQTPTVCKPDNSILYVKGNNDIVLNGNGFKCEMTSVGTTTIRIMFNIDYIDVDYGYIGGYYSIGLSGPANGGGSGYGMIRLVKEVKPLKPVVGSKQPEVKEAVAPSQPVAVVQPCVGVQPCYQPVPVVQPVAVAPKMPTVDVHVNVSTSDQPTVAPKAVYEATDTHTVVHPSGSNQASPVYVDDLDDYMK